MQDHLRELEALKVIHGHVGHGVGARWERCAGRCMARPPLSWENGLPELPQITSAVC